MTAVRFDFYRGAKNARSLCIFHKGVTRHTTWATIMRSMLSVSYGICGVSPNAMRAGAFRKNWLGSLDYHMISMTYRNHLCFPYLFPSRATVDATFVPWLWASVNRTGERQ
jgi:hypothetical protein